jgi:alanyl aminopeptidase
MDHFEPAARRRLGAVIARERIMEADAGERAMPVRRRLQSRAEMESVYNRFVYQKGAAVLLMLEAWLGDEPFRDGLRAYLHRHRFGTATTADLAATLRSATSTDVSGVLKSFLDDTGVPSLRVRTMCDDSGKRLLVEQSGSKLWSAPLCWKTDQTARSCAVIGKRLQEVELGATKDCPAWVFPNAGGTGYYRTVWEPSQLVALRMDQLTAAERLTLTYDLRALKRAGRIEAPGQRLLMELAADAEPAISAAAKAALARPRTSRER